MKKSIWVSVVALVAVTVLVIVGAIALLSDGSAEPSASPETTSASGVAGKAPGGVDKQLPRFDVAARPDCPAGGVGGVDLPCLGGETTEQERADVTVAVVWAYWCPPCREELGMIDEFAAAHPEWEVLGVHSDPNAAAGADLLNELGVKMRSYQDDAGKFAGLLGLPPVVPVTVVFAQGAPVGIFPDTFTSPEDLEAAVESVI